MLIVLQSHGGMGQQGGDDVGLLFPLSFPTGYKKCASSPLEEVQEVGKTVVWS